MHRNHDVYGQINNQADMHKVFSEIREDVSNAESRPDLTELYRRAGYLITLTYAPSWAEKFGPEAGQLRQLGEDEFRKTAHRINQRAHEIGTEGDYKETWGRGDH